jgi:putative DNA primase/helicase
MSRYQSMGDAANASVVPEELEVISADSVKIESVDWLWPNRFALGKLGLLGGSPERGKGLIISDMFSRITRGAPWPCNEGTAPKGDCVLLQQEDEDADTVVPRLTAAGADLKRVKLIKMITKVDGSGRRMFDLNTDLQKLRDVLKSLDNPTMLAIDPLDAYIGKLNAASGNEVRSALAPLVDLIKEFHLAAVGVKHFNKRTEVDNALARIADSVAFGALARHCFVVTDDPENERRLLVKAKNNLAPDVKALSYTIRPVHAGTDHRDGREIYAPRIDWGYEHVEISAVQAMRAEANGTAAVNPRKAAKEFMIKLLTENGEMLHEDVVQAIKGEPFSMSTVKNIKKEAGIESAKGKGSMTGKWVWRLAEAAKAGEANCHWREEADAEQKY